MTIMLNREQKRLYAVFLGIAAGFAFLIGLAAGAGVFNGAGA